MGHLAHNWCSSSVKCRRNINRLQNTRLLCSTNSESDSCLWFWRFFHMRWIHSVHFACLVKMWCFSWLSVKWLCWDTYMPFIHCLGCACCWLYCVRKCDPVLGGTWSWLSVPCPWAPELCCKCGSLETAQRRRGTGRKEPHLQKSSEARKRMWYTQPTSPVPSS